MRRISIDYLVWQCYELASKEGIRVDATGFEYEDDGDGNFGQAIEYTYSELTTCNGTKTATGVEFS